MDHEGLSTYNYKILIHIKTYGGNDILLRDVPPSMVMIGFDQARCVCYYSLVLKLSIQNAFLYREARLPHGMRHYVELNIT